MYSIDDGGDYRKFSLLNTLSMDRLIVMQPSELKYTRYA